MTNDSKKLFKLLKYSDELRKENLYLAKENSHESRKLLAFLAVIEENLHLKEKKEYIELMEMFLNNQIDAENFSFCFIAKYDEINETLRVMGKNFETNFNELSSLLIENEKSQIGMSLMFMYDQCDDFDPSSNSSISDEENLRNAVTILLSELKRA